jgi:hypothetical protein
MKMHLEDIMDAWHQMTEEQIDALIKDHGEFMLEMDPECFDGMTEEQKWEYAQEDYWYTIECTY